MGRDHRLRERAAPRSADARLYGTRAGPGCGRRLRVNQVPQTVACLNTRSFFHDSLPVVQRNDGAT